MAKAASNKAYLESKRKYVEKDIAQQQGTLVDDPNEFVDIFESQAHHLLACLEKTTVRTTIHHILHIADQYLVSLLYTLKSVILKTAYF